MKAAPRATFIVLRKDAADCLSFFGADLELIDKPTKGNGSAMALLLQRVGAKHARHCLGSSDIPHNRYCADNLATVVLQKFREI